MVLLMVYVPRNVSKSVEGEGSGAGARRFYYCSTLNTKVKYKHKTENIESYFDILYINVNIVIYL